MDTRLGAHAVQIHAQEEEQQLPGHRKAAPWWYKLHVEVAKHSILEPMGATGESSDHSC